ncbi:MAG: single-stranded DNA-binding protein [Lachnospiraceae bacterium]|nr:single-stranded DNA-binding protein [Lachnospiraceae bacterium]
MNKVILMGRLTRDPEVRYSQNGDTSRAIARYTLAVDRRFTSRNGGDNQQNADFISIVAFGKSGEFAEKYFHKGIKVVVTGRIQTGSYVNKDGQTVYTTEVVAEDQEFAESKNSNAGYEGGFSGNAPAQSGQPSGAVEGFMNLPDNGSDDELPF